MLYVGSKSVVLHPQLVGIDKSAGSIRSINIAPGNEQNHYQKFGNLRPRVLDESQLTRTDTHLELFGILISSLIERLNAPRFANHGKAVLGGKNRATRHFNRNESKTAPI